MRRKKELTKARLIKDLNITSTNVLGVVFIIAGLSCLVCLIINWQTILSKIGLSLPIIGMMLLAFTALGGFMLYSACKDRHDIKNNKIAIFTDKVLRLEPIQTRPSNRVYFEEYTKHCGFGAVELNLPNIKVGDEYLLIKLPTSNFVVLAYPCSAFKLHQELNDSLKTPSIALIK